MSGSAAQDWLANMILTVKTIAAGAEFTPVPYIRAAFCTVVILLETVDVRQRTSVPGSSAHEITENEEESRRFARLMRKYRRNRPLASG
jgi:hypothetical protein